jgi:hypothetical protein
MSLINTDLFIVERGGVQYKMTADAIADFVGAVRDYTTADIAGRDALTDLNVGDRVFVTNATADGTVTTGWAVYRVQSTGPIVYAKIQEQESMDLVISASTNLSFTAGAGSGIVVSDTGSNATIPLADGSNAGLMPPAMFTSSHDAATVGLTAATNPLNIAGQVLTFGVTQLTALP